MKNTILLLTVAILLMASACKNKDSTTAEGIWAFNTLEGDYAELWMDGTSLLTIKSSTRSPYVFGYIRNGDTIKLYQHGQSPDHTIDLFVIESLESGKMHILQDGHKNDLTLINREIATIQNDKAYMNEVISEFDLRTAENKH